MNAIDDTGRSPLIHAAEKGHAKIVRELCCAGADLWVLTKTGLTADILAHNEEIRAILREEMAKRSKQS